MGSRGGSAPNGFPQRQLTTLFLRVPVVDWPKVKIGLVSEFRTMPGEKPKVTHANVPTLVCAYAKGNGAVAQLDARAMMLEERRFEPLFSIAEDKEALRRAGFDDYHAFRADWKARHRGAYRPMQMTYIWRVRLLMDKDIVTEGARMARHLYGQWLPTSQERLRNELLQP
jgi:hypothetical protein